jgi:ABC-type branched-subunit amino acid transport system permease subunit
MTGTLLTVRDDTARRAGVGVAVVAGCAVVLELGSALGFWVVPESSLIQGTVIGLNYGLLALGLVLIYRTSRVLNFAQGQLGVVAAIFLLKLSYDYGIFYWAVLPLVLVIAAGVGALCELLLRRLFGRPRVLVMVATIGLAQVLYLVTVLPFVKPKNFFVPYPLPFSWHWTVGSYLVPPGEVVTLIVAPLVALALALFLAWSPWGLAMRASAENADSARLSGIWVKRTSTVAWTIAGLLSAITAILNAPGKATALDVALPPGVLLRALAAALIGAMVGLGPAFFAGIGIGILQQVLDANFHGSETSGATIELWLFVLLLAVLLVRVRALRVNARTEERSSWNLTGSASRRAVVPPRPMWFAVGAAVLLLVAGGNSVLSTGQWFLVGRICIYAVIALSLTMLIGWAGQVSLGHFGLVAVGAIFAARLGNHMDLLPLLLIAGVATAIVAVIVGLPALRIKGLYLAVTTLGFALFMESAVLPTPCWTMPVTGRKMCTGLPQPTVLARPSFLGIDLRSDRSFALFALGLLLFWVAVVRLWRDRGIARRLIAVRDNESAAGAMGIPVVRTKLLAFMLSGFMAGTAGVCLAFALQRFDSTAFPTSESIVIVSMVVIGGLGSVEGAILGAVYLLGLPALFGSAREGSSTAEFLTSGVGLLAFLLYFPGGIAELVRGGARLAADGLDRLRRSAGLGPPTDPPAGSDAPGSPDAPEAVDPVPVAP